MAGVIRHLDETVVNRIAAGEVIQRPVNAIKEMLENSIDAGSTQIQVAVRQGGLKVIQIQDNGSGIHKEDMEIVCERFTTSKLQEFSDLQKISTYGFRGEALASISHVAHLTITARTAGSKCAYKSDYLDGKPKGSIRPCAGNQGTCIHAEDLFYNVPLRRNTLKAPREEFARIAEMMTKYAVHNSGRGISLRRLDESAGGTDIKTLPGASFVDNIKAIYGGDVARELLTLNHTNDKLNYSVKGYITNANYSTKKMTFLLFINNRLVDSTSLRKAIETVYAAILPKNSYPFVYLDLQLAAHNVDVNVHPTKHEVHFLHEDAIVASVQRALETLLLSANESRTFLTQSLLPGNVISVAPVMDKVRAQDMVRTDANEQKIDSFFQIRSSQSMSSNTVQKSSENPESMKQARPKPNNQISNEKKSESVNRRQVKLVSVLAIQEDINKASNNDLRSTFRNMTFVGCVDEELCLVQHETTLMLLNLRKISQALFYQLLMFEFGNIGEMVLSEPPPLRDLALVALDLPQAAWKPEDGDKEQLAGYAVKVLRARAAMLWDYFSIKIDTQNGILVSLPLLLEQYVPDLDALPLLILRLATEVNWDSEKECFQSLGLELSRFYAQKYSLFPKESGENMSENCLYKKTIEHVLFPRLKTSFMPSKKHWEDGSILQLTSLHDLYKVFERC